MGHGLKKKSWRSPFSSPLITEMMVFNFIKAF